MGNGADFLRSIGLFAELDETDDGLAYLMARFSPHGWACVTFTQDPDRPDAWGVLYTDDDGMVTTLGKRLSCPVAWEVGFAFAVKQQELRNGG